MMEMRMNELAGTQRTEDETQKLALYEETRTRLELTEKRSAELEGKFDEINEKWSAALGNEKAALEALEDLQTRHLKRWLEFVGEGEDPSTNELQNGRNGASEELTVLQHKLSQALENVRQAESLRDTLQCSIQMNESLQQKLEDAKTKLNTATAAATAAAATTTAIVTSTATASRNNASSASASSGANATTTANATTNSISTSTSTVPANLSVATENASAKYKEKDREQYNSQRDGTGTETSVAIDKNASITTNNDKPASSGGERHVPSSSDRSEKYEKLQREHRRMRKDLATLTASKENAKAKIERMEKERDGLIETTNRLLRQITEKDEMNAKSLSTILHLKSVSEQIMLEKEKLEEEAKSASQLALAARLTTNAKERVNEELAKENEQLVSTVRELEAKVRSTTTDFNTIIADFSSSSAKISRLETDLKKQLERCNELTAECSDKKAELHSLVDSLDRAQRDASAMKDKLESLTKQQMEKGGVVSSFSVEQLNTQIQVLKNRLACPVCHYRDKECIIMRCRHMHCKQCVDERISNRSRKCPTCNNKFAENDVEDVWLN
jgi:DNA repair exonuclease SbcCD ATPase subunit